LRKNLTADFIDLRRLSREQRYDLERRQRVRFATAEGLAHVDDRLTGFLSRKPPEHCATEIAQIRCGVTRRKKLHWVAVKGQRLPRHAEDNLVQVHREIRFAQLAVTDLLPQVAGLIPRNDCSHSLRYALNAQGKAVVLVSGSTRERDAVFRGFNSPLLPEILICTQVGQEGIDLHRHCRHVVHYDLGWNPVTIEQRTGRVDRIGSKTQRERQLLANDRLTERELPGLEVGLPYLAATYDERMFDRLYARAQAFELLTGGDAALDPNGAKLRRI
jgi:hypothetical protein